MMYSILRPVVLVAAAGATAFVVFALGLSWYGQWDDQRTYGMYVSDGYCNIAVVPVQGEIVVFDGALSYPGGEQDSGVYMSTTGDWTNAYIHAAENDPAVQGILVTIDSYGGQASPASEMMDTLAASPLPVAAYIREAGASAAYMVALGADYIVANPFASVGSIGVTYSYLDQSEKNEREGIHYVQLSSGPFKDAGSPDKALTSEERARFERDLEIFEDVFVGMVAQRRGMSIDDAKQLADGDAWPAILALDHGLVDEVGNMESARKWFAKMLGIPEEGIVFCN